MIACDEQVQALYESTLQPRVVITPDVVLIWRGLRPLPRRYRRPPYARAVRLDQAV
jgi:hypothetical protein